MLTVTKKFNFCYGHNLPSYTGKCIQHHGHNSIVEVEIAEHDGNPESYTSMVVDFKTMKGTIAPIIDALDHTTLNASLPDAFQPPTAENIVRYLVGRIEPLFPGLVRVRVSETDDSFAEWRKD